MTNDLKIELHRRFYPRRKADGTIVLFEHIEVPRQVMLKKFPYPFPSMEAAEEIAEYLNMAEDEKL